MRCPTTGTRSWTTGERDIYVYGRCEFDFEGEPVAIVALVTPEGSIRQVADPIAFTNGMVVAPMARP
jgi:hypothetical protein